MKKFLGKTSNEKPRVRFCWLCGKKLYGNKHLEKPMVELTGDVIPRIIHKYCYIEDYFNRYLA